MGYNFDLLKKPTPFSSGNMNLWDDEYIAQNVLKKHLDYDIDSGSRKWVTIQQTIRWIKEKFRNATSVLDIGCGPGLYANLFIKNGFLYTGIDISPYQIEYAKKHNHYETRIKYFQSDFRNWEYKNNYDLILLLYGIYSFYPKNIRIELLKKLKKTLSPNGCVIIEVFTAKHYENRVETRDWDYFESGGFWSEKPYIELNAFYRYDDINLILVQAAKIDSSIKVWNSWIQTFSIELIIEELKLGGFKRFECYDTCTGKELSNTSETLCVCAYCV